MSSGNRSFQYAVVILLLILIVGVAAEIVHHYIKTNSKHPIVSDQLGGHPDLGLGARGRIASVSSNSITIASRTEGPKTFSISATTEFTIDGQPGTADSLQNARFAMVSSKDGVTASAIFARTHRMRFGSRDGGHWGGSGGIVGGEWTNRSGYQQPGESPGREVPMAEPHTDQNSPTDQ